MPGYNIAAMKHDQDEFDARVNKLLERFHPFRDGFFEELRAYIDKALAAGLRGIQPLKDRSGHGRYTLTDFMLNDFALTLATSDDVLPFKQDGQLIARILGYPKSVDDVKPFFDVIVLERTNSAYQCELRVLMPSQIALSRFANNEVSREQGQMAADVLINWLNGVSSAWVERPLLSRLVTSDDRTGPFGLVP